MALLHVNSTSGGTPTSPYDTWTKAATTIGAAALVAVAGDEVFVHPSHTETSNSNIGWAGLGENPIKLICGTPGATQRHYCIAEYRAVELFCGWCYVCLGRCLLRAWYFI